METSNTRLALALVLGGAVGYTACTVQLAFGAVEDWPYVVADGRPAGVPEAGPLDPLLCANGIEEVCRDLEAGAR